MTPAINRLKKAKLTFKTHSYDHDPKSTAFGDEVVEKLNLSSDQTFKTLVVETMDKGLVVAVLPVSCQLDLKKISKAVGTKKTKMADQKIVQKTTGYIVGGVSPVGQKKLLKTIIDSTALDFETIYVSAGRRGLQLELAPEDLASVIRAEFEDIGKL